MFHIQCGCAHAQTKDDQLLECCKIITSAIPAAEVCVHYSLKWNYKQGVKQSFQAFADFCESLPEEKHLTVLLVSGGGKKRKLDTVEVSQQPRVPFKGQVFSMLRDCILT